MMCIPISFAILDYYTCLYSGGDGEANRVTKNDEKDSDEKWFLYNIRGV